MSVSATIKDQIVNAIAKSDDPQLKTVLMLMLHMQEEIVTKMDAVLADEKKLKELVLNGSAAEHDQDHTWVRERRAQAETLVDDHAWVRAQRDDAAENKRSQRKIRDGLILNIVWGVIAGACTYLGAHLV